MGHCTVVLALVWLAMSCGLPSTPAAAGQVEQKRFAAKSYPGSRDRDYKVFVPASYTGQTPVPMVMVLHGCSQTEQNMLAETRFRELAEQDGFIAAYPFITSYDGFRSPNCWGFFIDQHIHEGAGEPEDLYQIAREVESAFKIDPKIGTRGLKPAVLNGRDFSYQECGLPGGSYTTRAAATDAEGLAGTDAGPTVEIAALDTATANWQGHMSANRIRVYGSPCANFGFGTCDAGFADIFSRHAFNPFPLLRRPAASDWYENAANVP